MRLIYSLILSSILFFAMPLQAEPRWYDQARVAKGEKLFIKNCMVCHGANAASTSEWRKKTATGHYPPPPLDGSAHTWHHIFPLLKHIIKKGGGEYDGVMPPFEKVLKDEEIDAIIAYFQDKWPDKFYDIWASRHRPGELPVIKK